MRSTYPQCILQIQCEGEVDDTPLVCSCKFLGFFNIFHMSIVFFSMYQWCGVRGVVRCGISKYLFVFLNIDWYVQSICWFLLICMVRFNVFVGVYEYLRAFSKYSLVFINSYPYVRLICLYVLICICVFNILVGIFNMYLIVKVFVCIC